MGLPDAAAAEAVAAADEVDSPEDVSVEAMRRRSAEVREKAQQHSVEQRLERVSAELTRRRQVRGSP